MKHFVPPFFPINIDCFFPTSHYRPSIQGHQPSVNPMFARKEFASNIPCMCKMHTEHTLFMYRECAKVRAKHAILPQVTVVLLNYLKQTISNKLYTVIYKFDGASGVFPFPGFPLINTTILLLFSTNVHACANACFCLSSLTLGLILPDLFHVKWRSRPHRGQNMSNSESVLFDPWITRHGQKACCGIILVIHRPHSREWGVVKGQMRWLSCQISC